MRDAEGFGQSAGVQASGAAEGDKSEVAGIASAFDRNDADGFLHGGIDNPNHARGKLLKRQSRALFLEPLFGDGSGASLVKNELSTEELCRPEASQDQVRIGDCWLKASAITDRARIGSSGFGSDAENTSGVEAGERSSSGAYGMD